MCASETSILLGFHYYVLLSSFDSVLYLHVVKSRQECRITRRVSLLFGSDRVAVLLSSIHDTS